MADQTVTLFHAPHTRSTGVLTLLEELGAPYKLDVLDRGRDQHREPAFLAINPLGKVPALRDAAGQIVIEQVAIALHLADLFPAAGLAPPIGDPMRGPYLRWMVFYAASFEPAIVDRARGHEPGQRGMSPYGNYDSVIEMIIAGLTPGPYLLGEKMSAADVLWGTALHWTMAFKLVPHDPALVAYAERIAERPASKRAGAIDQELLAKQKA